MTNTKQDRRNKVRHNLLNGKWKYLPVVGLTRNLILGLLDDADRCDELEYEYEGEGFHADIKRRTKAANKIIRETHDSVIGKKSQEDLLLILDLTEQLYSSMTECEEYREAIEFLINGCSVIRCKKTGSPSGTDTWMVGNPCDCSSCKVYLYLQELIEGKGFGGEDVDNG